MINFYFPFRAELYNIVTILSAFLAVKNAVLHPGVGTVKLAINMLKSISAFLARLYLKKGRAKNPQFWHTGNYADH